jgi:hypothetical protein
MDLMNNLQWTSETNLHATEALAEYLQIELPTVDVPATQRRRSDTTYSHLVSELQLLRAEDPFLTHAVRLAFRTTWHLARVAEIGDAIVEAAAGPAAAEGSDRRGARVGTLIATCAVCKWLHRRETSPSWRIGGYPN